MISKTKFMRDSVNRRKKCALSDRRNGGTGRLQVDENTMLRDARKTCCLVEHRTVSLYPSDDSRSCRCDVSRKTVSRGNMKSANKGV